jgi:hypothetical protein
MCSVLCVLCCFILPFHGIFSVLLHYFLCYCIIFCVTVLFSVLLYSSLLLCCSLLFILLCSSSCYVCVLDCIHIVYINTRILRKLEFSGQIFEKTQMSGFIKIRPMRAEFFNADGQTDDIGLNVTASFSTT